MQYLPGYCNDKKQFPLFIDACALPKYDIHDAHDNIMICGDHYRHTRWDCIVFNLESLAQRLCVRLNKYIVITSLQRSAICMYIFKACTIVSFLLKYVELLRVWTHAFTQLDQTNSNGLPSSV